MPTLTDEQTRVCRDLLRSINELKGNLSVSQDGRELYYKGEEPFPVDLALLLRAYKAEMIQYLWGDAV